MTYLIENAQTGQLAAQDCQGEHDGRFTNDANEARIFDTRGQASDFAQNFGPDWSVMEY
jgi:hypothetical protein